MFRSYVPVCLVAASLLMASSVRAAIIYDNISASTGATSGGDAGITGSPLADSFSTGSGVSTLSDVKLAIDALTPADGGSFTVSLYSNNPIGPVPGTLISTLATVPDGSLTSSLKTYDFPSSSIPLAASTRYWIELGGASTSGRWSFTNTNVGVGVANEYNYFAGTSFANSAFTPQQATITTASSVPEPASLSLLGLTALSMLRRRSRRVVAI